MTTTQTEHPWKATIRTAFQAIVGLAAIVPLVVDELGAAVPYAAAVVAVAATITRVMAIPQVEAFLERFVPWLAASPSEER